MQLVLFRYFI